MLLKIKRPVFSSKLYLVTSNQPNKINSTKLLSLIEDIYFRLLIVQEANEFLSWNGNLREETVKQIIECCQIRRRI